MRAWKAQTRAEVTMTLRRGESILLTLGIPVGLLVFFSLVDVLPKPAGVKDAVTFLAPGILALAVMSTAMVSLGIATGFERQYGVLKRLGSTPLGRPALLGAKTTAMLVVEALQVAVVVIVALLLGWSPHGTPGLSLLAILLASIGFAGLGLLMAGSLRAEVTLAAANGLYLVLLRGPVGRHAWQPASGHPGTGAGVAGTGRLGGCNPHRSRAQLPLGVTADLTKSRATPSPVSGPGRLVMTRPDELTRMETGMPGFGLTP